MGLTKMQNVGVSSNILSQDFVSSASNNTISRKAMIKAKEFARMARVFFRTRLERKIVCIRILYCFVQMDLEETWM
jgi:hypothetical protein